MTFFILIFNKSQLSSYDFQFPRIDSNHNLTSLGNIGMIDDQLLNNDMNRNFMWSKDKINKNESFAGKNIEKLLNL